MQRLTMVIAALLCFSLTNASLCNAETDEACTVSAATIKKNLKASYSEAKFLLKTCTDMNALRMPFQQECMPLMNNLKPQAESLEKRIERQRVMFLTTSSSLEMAANHLQLCCTCNASLAAEQCWMAERELLEYEEAFPSVGEEIKWWRSEFCPKKK